MTPTTLLSNAAKAQVSEPITKAPPATDTKASVAVASSPDPVSPAGVSFADVWSWLLIAAGVVTAFTYVFKKFYGVLKEIDDKQTKVDSRVCRTCVEEKIAVAEKKTEQAKGEMLSAFASLREEVQMALRSKADMPTLEAFERTANAKFEALADKNVAMSESVAVLKVQFDQMMVMLTRMDKKLDRISAVQPTLKPGQFPGDDE